METSDNEQITIYFDVFRTRQYFYSPLLAKYYRDPFQNISSRVTIGAGIGYHVIDTSKTNWDITVGPAFQSTRFVSVESGKDSSESTPALFANTSFDTELTKKLDLIAVYNFNIVNEESGRYSHHAIATMKAEVTDLLNFDISFVWDRTEKPKLRADGTLPKQNDFQLIFGVEVDF